LRAEYGEDRPMFVLDGLIDAEIEMENTEIS
jgi:hypothetical protein